MGDEYAAVKRGKLILKGDKPKAKKRKHKKKDKDDETNVDEDCVKHGGWWRVSRVEDITGLFTIGAPHAEGEGPSPEEIFTAFPAGENKFALKSGYGKYLGVSKDGVVTGRSDAVGPMEQWEPVFQDGQTAILSSMNKFMSVNPEDDSVVATSTEAHAAERCSVRSGRARHEHREKHEQHEHQEQDEHTDLSTLEVNYVKKFQKFQDKRLRVHDGGAGPLRRARDRGRLHEALLDRRAVMKADRYCK
ncbi:protein FRG1 homolog isoform X2 [Battus philenor]|uniref:protein FRG1 homolog isoform X2 n=1 Tax=Battus philenor TaxID=42288 RepID=UPI0035CF13DD